MTFYHPATDRAPQAFNLIFNPKAACVTPDINIPEAYLVSSFVNSMMRVCPDYVPSIGIPSVEFSAWCGGKPKVIMDALLEIFVRMPVGALYESITDVPLEYLSSTGWAVEYSYKVQEFMMKVCENVSDMKQHFQDNTMESVIAFSQVKSLDDVLLELL